MSVTAAFVGAADGNLDPGIEYRQVGNTMQKRDHWTVSLSQQVVGLTAFAPSVGSTTNNFTYAVGGGSTLTYTATGKTFHCTRDNLVSLDMAIGEFREEQVWEWFGEWEDVDPEDFVE